MSVVCYLYLGMWVRSSHVPNSYVTYMVAVRCHNATLVDLMAALSTSVATVSSLAQV